MAKPRRARTGPAGRRRAADKLYPLDLDRAFKKLDTIKKDIVWWGGGAQSQQLLASGEASMGQFWNGRIHALQEDGAPGVSWKQNLVMADILVIPKARKQGRGDEVPGQRQQRQGPGRLLQPDRLRPGQRRQRARLDSVLAPNLPTAYAQDQITLISPTGPRTVRPSRHGGMNGWSNEMTATASRPSTPAGAPPALPAGHGDDAIPDPGAALAGGNLIPALLFLGLFFSRR
jgi:hypothetical protein